MKSYDWIVIGGGFTGSALSYELVKKGFRVLLIEKDKILDNATSYSYGGLAYWSGMTEINRQLGREGIELYRDLSLELEADIEFREISLLLTIDSDDDPVEIAARYKDCLITPDLLTVEEACEFEPLLNAGAISGGLRLPHGHINPIKTNKAYQEAFCRAGGEIVIDEVVKLIGDRSKIEGVQAKNQAYYGANTVVCAGGLSRRLLKELGIDLNIYFNHSQILKTQPLDIKLNAVIMPSVLKRFELEREITRLERESLWDELRDETVAENMDAGAVQFLDGSIILGQITQIMTNPQARINSSKCEGIIREAIGKILPSLRNIPGTLQTCLVAFSGVSMPPVGKINEVEGLQVFSGFTSTLIFAPILARYFARAAAGEKDLIISKLM